MCGWGSWLAAGCGIAVSKADGDAEATGLGIERQSASSPRHRRGTNRCRSRSAEVDHRLQRNWICQQSKGSLSLLEWSTSGLHPSRTPCREPLHREVQREIARRVLERRGVLQPGRRPAQMTELANLLNDQACPKILRTIICPAIRVAYCLTLSLSPVWR